jgi:hypothetical protein
MADIDDSQSGSKALAPAPSGTAALKVSLAPAGYAPLIQQAAAKHGVPADVLAWVGQRESSFRPDAVGIPTSTGRAQGMYQFMPSTAADLGIDPMNPAQAIDGAARYLRKLFDAHGGNWEAAVKAYGTFATGVGRDRQVQADFEKRFGNPKADAGGFQGFSLPSSGTAALARQLPVFGELPGKQHLDPALAPTVPDGAPRPFAPGEWVSNPDGSWSSEISATVEDPALNGGRATVVPALWLVDGKPVRVDEDTAARYAAQSGLQFKSYDTLEQAEQASQTREDAWQGIAPEKAWTVPPLWDPAAPNASGQRNQALRTWEAPNSKGIAPAPTRAEAAKSTARALGDLAPESILARLLEGLAGIQPAAK